MFTVTDLSLDPPSESRCKTPSQVADAVYVATVDRILADGAKGTADRLAPGETYTDPGRFRITRSLEDAPRENGGGAFPVRPSYPMYEIVHADPSTNDEQEYMPESADEAVEILDRIEDDRAKWRALSALVRAMKPGDSIRWNDGLAIRRLPDGPSEDFALDVRNACMPILSKALLGHGRETAERVLKSISDGVVRYAWSMRGEIIRGSKFDTGMLSRAMIRELARNAGMLD